MARRLDAHWDRVAGNLAPRAGNRGLVGPVAVRVGAVAAQPRRQEALDLDAALRILEPTLHALLSISRIVGTVSTRKRSKRSATSRSSTNSTLKVSWLRRRCSTCAGSPRRGDTGRTAVGRRGEGERPAFVQRPRAQRYLRRAAARKLRASCAASSSPVSGRSARRGDAPSTWRAAVASESGVDFIRAFDASDYGAHRSRAEGLRPGHRGFRRRTRGSWTAT